jgi:hypothetical protein
MALALLSPGIASFAQRIEDLPKVTPRTGAQNRPNTLAQNRLPLLPLDAMKGYLKLTEEQVEKIKPLQDKANGALKELLANIQPRNGQPPADQAKRIEMTNKFQETVAACNKDIQAILTEEQKKKVPEMEKEIQLFNSVGLPPATLGDLNLTEEQKKKLKTLSNETQLKRGELKREERETKGKEINNEARRLAMEILTEEQRAVVEKWRKEHPVPASANRPAPAPPKP